MSCKTINDVTSGKNRKTIDRINKSGCSYSLSQYKKDTLKPNKNIFNTKSNKF